MSKPHDRQFEEALAKSAVTQLSFVPKHHEQYQEGPFSGAWHQRLWTSHVDVRVLMAEKRQIEEGGGLVVAVDRGLSSLSSQLTYRQSHEMSHQQRWIEHAYPLQQIRIELQGTRHSKRADVINQLEKVLERLRAGELSGLDCDDDFGYRFQVTEAAQESFFDEPAAFK